MSLLNMGKLYVSLIALLCVDLSGQERSFKKTILRKVRPGDNVTLNCDVKHDADTEWYIKRFNDSQPPLNISGMKQISSPLPRFLFVWNCSSNTFGLRIENFTESDVGLYYCASLYKMLKTGKDGKLRDEDIYNEGNVATKLLIADDPTLPCPTLPPSSTWLDQNWVLLVSIIPALALICVTLSVFTYWLGKRQGSNKSEVQQKRTRLTGRVSREQEEDGGLNYATLEIRKGTKRPKAPRAQPSDFCTYSEVNSSRV